VSCTVPAAAAFSSYCVSTIPDEFHARGDGARGEIGIHLRNRGVEGALHAAVRSPPASVPSTDCV